MFARLNKGAILIELMMTIALSLMLLMTLMQLYLTTLHSVRLQMALQQIQHQAATAISILRSSVHQSGYIGCPKLSESFPMDGELTVQNKLQGIQSNTLQVRHAASEHATLVEGMHNKNLIFASSEPHFPAGTIVLISNCQHAEIFTVKTSIHVRRGQKLISDHSLHYRYDKNSEVSRYINDTFYISKSTLYRKDMAGKKTRLVSGIEDMQFEYTVKSEDQFIQLKTEQIADWSQVVGVAAHLLLSSPPFKKEWYAYFRV
jgi:type IV pilus assembly protein PilW